MLILDHDTAPAFNLAADEFLLREVEEPVVRLWRNSPCVVVGRHQIPCMEVNLMEAYRRDIPVHRRISGGGAVYHDLGNVNFSIIAPLEKGKGIDFERMLAPVIEALNALGIPARHLGRGDVRLGEFKISGNAAYLWRGRCLHHGTLLFDADLDALEALLDVQAEQEWQGRSVRSIRSRVVNIDPFVTERFANTPAFMNSLAQELGHIYGTDHHAPRAFSEAEKERIGTLRNSKYATPEWICGAAPAYRLERMLDDQHTALHLSVRNGQIESVELSEDKEENLSLCKTLKGCWHDPKSLTARLEKLNDQPKKPPNLRYFF